MCQELYIECQQSVERNQEHGSTKLLKTCMKKFFKTLLLLCYAVTTADSWFLYVPVVNDDNKCIKFDKDLLVVAIAVSIVPSIYYIIDIFRPRSSIRKSSRKRSCVKFFFYVLLIIPIPQVLMSLVMLQTMRGMELLVVVILLQQLLKTRIIFKVYMKALISTKLTELAFEFILYYMQTGNVIGAEWYYFAIVSQSLYWKKTCINRGGYANRSFRCDDHLRDYKFLNDFCSMDAKNSTLFSGIFVDAFKSGVLGKTDFQRRFSFCLRWGVQSLSSIGQGIQANTDPWENYFLIYICVCWVWLFVFVVRRIQAFSKCEFVSAGMGMELARWLPFRKLSRKLQEEIMHHPCLWEESRNFDIEKLVNNLPEDIGEEIKSELCLELLKKVEEFGKWEKALLKDMCGLVKPYVYLENYCIVHQGSSIDEMIFVVQGKLLIRSSNEITAALPSTNNHDGHIFGKELVTWALDACTGTGPLSSNRPTSTITIETRSKVEVFLLNADDLKEAVITKHSQEDPFVQAARLIKLLVEAVKPTFTRNVEMSTQEQVSSATARVSMQHEEP